jgi:hypothetical protein
VEDDNDEEEEEVCNEGVATAIAKVLPALRCLRKRAIMMEEGTEPQRKKFRLFNYDRAIMCINEDYLGPDALFSHYFERVCRVTRGIVEQILQVAGNATSFFTLQQHNKVTGKAGIRPEAKVLIALKQMVFGVAGIATTDYFQMSDMTARKCLKDLCKIISTSPELRSKYLRSPTRADTCQLSRMHEIEFGVPGCIGCLDCMHVYWRMHMSTSVAWTV